MFSCDPLLLFAECSPFLAFELCQCTLVSEVQFVYYFQATLATGEWEDPWHQL